MLPLFKKTALAVFSLAVLPTVGFSAALTLNGNCERGDCSLVDTLAAGGANQVSFGFYYTFANTDVYQLSGNYATANSASGGTSILLNLTAVYEGNSLGTGSQRDVLTTDLLQNYNVLSSLTGFYSEDTYATLSGPLANGSSFTGQLYYEGEGLGLLGTFSGDGIYYSSSETYLTNLVNPLEADFNLSYVFGYNSAPGATISTLAPRGSGLASPTPEPASWTIVILGACLLFSGLRKRPTRISARF